LLCGLIGPIPLVLLGLIPRNTEHQGKLQDDKTRHHWAGVAFISVMILTLLITFVESVYKVYVSCCCFVVLLLAVVGSCWQLLAVVGSCWQLLAISLRARKSVQLTSSLFVFVFHAILQFNEESDGYDNLRRRES
jgi:hypothetical protein